MNFGLAAGDGSSTCGRGTASGRGFLSLGTESGRGFRSLGTESGKGLRIFTACVAPATVDTEDVDAGGAGEVETVRGAGLADIFEEALGAGDGRGAGEALFVDDDLDRLTTGAGLGGKLRISSTFCDETLSLTILEGRSSGWGVGSCGRGRFGGLIAPAPTPAPFREIRSGWATGFGRGGGGKGKTLVGSDATTRGLGSFVLSLFEDFLKDKMP